jgi:hypothetical protein
MRAEEAERSNIVSIPERMPDEEGTVDRTAATEEKSGRPLRVKVGVTQRSTADIDAVSHAPG